MTIDLPGRLDQIFATPSGRWIVASTSDRAVYIISPVTGAIRRIANGLTEPSAIAVSDDLVYFARRNDRLALASVSIQGGTTRSLTELDEIPTTLVASDRGVFWSDVTGTIFSIQHDKPVRVIARDAAQFSLAGAMIVICGHDGNLRLQSPDDTVTRLGPCLSRWPWTANSAGFAIPSTEHILTVFRNGEAQSISFETGHTMPSPKFSQTG